MTSRGPLLSTGVLLLFLAIFIPLARRINVGRDRTVDADRLRHTYVAISLYESDHDGLPPGSLAFVQRDVDPTDFQSVADPESNRKPAKDSPDVSEKTNPFPYGWDAVVPASPPSPILVSWSYRYHWKEAGDPRATSLDPRLGILADPWPGAILRVNMDGSLVEKPSAEPSFANLFGR